MHFCLSTIYRKQKQKLLWEVAMYAGLYFCSFLGISLSICAMVMLQKEQEKGKGNALILTLVIVALIIVTAALAYFGYKMVLLRRQ